MRNWIKDQWCGMWDAVDLALYKWAHPKDHDYNAHPKRITVYRTINGLITLITPADY